MCRPSSTARCAPHAAAHAWWGSPFIAPGDASAADYVLQHPDGEFGAGAGRGAGASLAVVLSFGGPSAREADMPGVVDSGGVILLGLRTDETLPASSDAHTVRVRGHVATVTTAESMTSAGTRRLIQWVVRDDGRLLEWSVIDDGRSRSLDAVVAIVDALAET
jgi:hypothetical protein